MYEPGTPAHVGPMFSREESLLLVESLATRSEWCTYGGPRVTPTVVNQDSGERASAVISLKLAKWTTL